jgi:hypothetical protein
LCSRGIVVSNGTVVADDTALAGLAVYLKSLATNDVKSASERLDRTGNGKARILCIKVYGDDGPQVLSGGGLNIKLSFEPWTPDLNCILTVYNSQGDSILRFKTMPWTEHDNSINPRGTTFVCNIPECPLVPGDYRINAALLSGAERFDHLEAAATFKVTSGAMRGRNVSFTPYATFETPYRWTQQ